MARRTTPRFSSRRAGPASGSTATTSSSRRPRRRLDKKVGLLSAFVDRDNVESLLRQLNVPQEFDLFSLDVDLNTYYLGSPDHALPRVVVVEYNASLPPDIDWKARYNPKAVWDGTLNSARA